jgi:hypothetical protein
MLRMVLRMARRLLDRLRELGRRLGDAADQSLRPVPDMRRVPAPVPSDVQPRARRRQEDSR